VSKNPADKAHPYSIINLEAMNTALATLKGGELALWLYLAKNQNMYSFALAMTDFCRSTAYSRNTYHNAVAALKEKGYLVKKPNTENTFIFYEGGHTVIDENSLDIEIPDEKCTETEEFKF
jgi:hypothetical protein